MPKAGRYEHEARFGIDDKLHKKISLIAKRRNESLAEVYRRLLGEAVDRELAEENQDYILQVVRQAVRDVQKPMEERLAKLSAKVAISSATTMYMNNQLIADAGYDHEDLYEKARKKATAFVKSGVLNDYIHSPEGEGK